MSQNKYKIQVQQSYAAKIYCEGNFQLLTMIINLDIKGLFQDALSNCWGHRKGA